MVKLSLRKATRRCVLTRRRGKTNVKRSHHGLNATQHRASPLSNRARCPTSAQSRAHRDAARGAFSWTACG